MAITMDTGSADIELHELSDPATGLSGVIAIHSTALGPAAGGCRLWDYPNMDDLITDARRLAEGMSYKNALAGLPMGGGKAVLQRPAYDFNRERLFEAFGAAVERLKGQYVTAEDVGTSTADMAAVARRTRHVAGLPPIVGRPGGDPSPWTARGVFLAMQAAVERKLGRSLDGVTVTVQGLGNVGYALCGMLHASGAKLFVCEPRTEVIRRAINEFDAVAVPPESLLNFPADVFAPCALGGVLDSQGIAKLEASIVCGAANNQLATAADGERLANKGVLYAPDYVVNAGGIINVAAEHFGWSVATSEEKISHIPERLIEVFDRSESLGIATNVAADAMARDIIAAGIA